MPGVPHPGALIDLPREFRLPAIGWIVRNRPEAVARSHGSKRRPLIATLVKTRRLLVRCPPKTAAAVIAPFSDSNVADREDQCRLSRRGTTAFERRIGDCLVVHELAREALRLRAEREPSVRNEPRVEVSYPKIGPFLPLIAPLDCLRHH